jgi:hypothetical protein
MLACCCEGGFKTGWVNLEGRHFEDCCCTMFPKKKKNRDSNPVSAVTEFCRFLKGDWSDDGGIERRDSAMNLVSGKFVMLEEE